MRTAGLHAVGLTKRFGAVVALRRVGLRVAPGEILAITGPPQAGKSTLLRVLATDLRADAGSFCINGLLVTSFAGQRPPLAAVRRAVGYLPAEADHLQGLTGEEECLLFARCHGIPARRARPEVEALLDWAGLLPLARVPVRRYTYAERRRLALVQALLHRPPALLLDEPARGQPTGFAERLAARLAAEAAHGAAVVVTGIAPAGARRLEMEGGRVP